MTGTISWSCSIDLIHVGQRLRFDALRGVHHQQRAFAGGQAARHFVGEIDVAGGVHEVELDKPRRSAACQLRRTVWALMVIPRSRSMSMLSSTCADISRAVSPPVAWISRSASVDLPWSMWAIIEKLRM